ncbi:hypothetical protein GGI04_004626, partial [Coemansia thaxteri]
PGAERAADPPPARVQEQPAAVRRRAAGAAHAGDLRIGGYARHRGRGGTRGAGLRGGVLQPDGERVLPGV